MCPATGSVRSGALVSCVTTALVSRQKCDGQERDAIDKSPSKSWAESVEDHACNVRELVGIGHQTDTFAAHCAKWEEWAARQTRVQQCVWSWQINVCVRSASEVNPSDTFRLHAS